MERVKNFAGINSTGLLGEDLLKGVFPQICYGEAKFVCHIPEFLTGYLISVVNSKFLMEPKQI
jgi:hypothetical protein